MNCQQYVIIVGCQHVGCHAVQGGGGADAQEASWQAAQRGGLAEAVRGHGGGVAGAAVPAQAGASDEKEDIWSESMELSKVKQIIFNNKPKRVFLTNRNVE